MSPWSGRATAVRSGAVLWVALALAGCSAEQDGAAPADAAPVAATPDSAVASPTHGATEPAELAPPSGVLFEGALLDGSSWAHYGTGVHEGESVAVADLLAEPAEHAGTPIRLTGQVVEVCQNQGCWIRIGSAEQNLLVQFKDYGFFLPKDCAGQQVVIEGIARVDETSVELRKHLLEDAGRHEEAARITEPIVEPKFTAHGVALAK